MVELALREVIDELEGAEARTHLVEGGAEHERLRERVDEILHSL
jgi:hypothetical protein